MDFWSQHAGPLRAFSSHKLNFAHSVAGRKRLMPACPLILLHLCPRQPLGTSIGPRAGKCFFWDSDHHCSFAVS